MPKYRSKRTNKRKFNGNQHTCKTADSDPKPINDETFSASKTASASKLSMSNDLYNDSNAEEFSGNRIINIDCLRNIFSLVCCPACLSNSLCFSEESRFGLFSYFTLCCQKCDFVEKFSSGKKSKRLLNINSRFVLGMRIIGKGISSAKKLCATLNLPPPPHNTAYKRHEKSLLLSATTVAQDSMNRAVDEVKDIKNSNQVITKCGVSVDGTWQRRGYSSLNGCVTVLSIDTGKVLDTEFLSQYCAVCSKLSKMENNLHCAIIRAEHTCSNYKGSSSGMEPVGVYRIFERSIPRYNLQYMEYYGDGDSKSFLSVKNVYENEDVEKLECIGHIQKRVGSRLRKLKSCTPGLGGKGKLTDKFIDKIQNYYGIAIRSNVGNLENMQQAVIAALFHCSSNANHPMHGQCPPGIMSWCKYQRAVASGKVYKEKSVGLSQKILNIVKPVYMELCDRKLLMKCLHGRTQNANESFNGNLWELVPKNTFVSLETLRFGGYVAVIKFNDGFKGLLSIFNELNIDPGYFTTKGYEKLDIVRINDSVRFSTPVAKLHRKKLRALRKKKITVIELKEGISYKAGEF